jgi:hypothetical protein
MGCGTTLTASLLRFLKAIPILFSSWGRVITAYLSATFSIYFTLYGPELRRTLMFQFKL